VRYAILAVVLTLSCVKPSRTAVRQAREFLYDLYGRHICRYVCEAPLDSVNGWVRCAVKCLSDEPVFEIECHTSRPVGPTACHLRGRP
jgi:hypothetical protein